MKKDLNDTNFQNPKNRLFTSSVFLLIFVFYVHDVFADDPGFVTPPTADDGLAAFRLTVPKDYISDFPNEYISSQNMNLSFEYKDINIPGPNGMDISIIRKYKRGAFPRVVGFGKQDWYLDLPGINTFRALQSGPASINIGCLQNIQSLTIGVGDSTLRSVGYSSHSKLPSNTLAALNDRSILICEGGYPVLKKNDGTRYIFGLSQINNTPSSVSTFYYLSKITDRFGNYINYQYAAENATFPTSYPRKKLIKITRSDGYIVNLNYEKIGNYEQIKSISYKNRIVNYYYNSNYRLTKFKDQEGREYLYGYAAYMNFLQSVTTPEKLMVVYDYYPFNADARNNGNLRGKTISGPGIITRQFFHEIMMSVGLSPNSYSRTKQVEFNVFPGQEKTIEYRFQEIANVSTSFQSGSIVLASKLVSKSVYLGYSGQRNENAYLEDKLLIKQENSWDYRNFGTAGCSYRIGTYRDDRRSCSTPVLMSEKISVNNNGIFDDYYLDYSQHNEFGTAKIVYEHNNINTKKRYTSKDFNSDFTNWVTNRLYLTKMSSDNINWKTALQIDYYPGTQGGGYQNQIKLIKEFNVIKKTFTQYHINGDKKTITDANNYVHSVLYHPNGKIKEFQYGNGKTYQLSLNSRSIPEQINVAGISDLTYYYDAANNITNIIDGINGAENRNMSYDGLDRVVSANGPWGSGLFEYDPLGNIMKKTLGVKNYNYYYNRTTNLLSSVTGSKSYSFEYDTQGNVKGNGLQTFVYDKANLLMNVNAGNIALYQYDANKKRVRVTEAAKNVYHFYNKSGKLLYKYNVSQNKGSDYIYINDLQVAKIDGVPGPQSPLSPAFITIPNYNTGGSFTVSWAQSVGATSYTLQEKKDAGSWLTVYSGSNLNKYLAGRTSASYQYRIRACSGAGCSQYRESKVLGVFNLDEVNLTPTVPAKPTAPTSDNDGNFYVNWLAVNGATTYDIQQKIGTGSWVTKQTLTGLSYHASSLLNGAYSYRVRACNSNGCSGYSPVTNVSVVIFNGGGVICQPGKICRIRR